MQKEKIAAVALVIIIVVALSVYLAAAYYPDIIKNLFKGKETIEIGDLADVNYIGKFASNNTVFDSSYADVDNKTDGTPLQIFVSLNKSESPPEGFETYTSGMIDGFIEGLIGLKEGQTYTIGPIPPEKAYGARKLKMGDTFNTKNIAFELNMSVEVTSITEENISLKWINVEDIDVFTSPQFVIKDFGKLIGGDQAGAITILPPYSLWENATKIIDITDDMVTIETTPTKTENITKEFTPFYRTIEATEYIFPDATTATWDNTSITITSSPEIGDTYIYSVELFGSIYNTTFTIEDVTDDKINISSLPDGEEEKTYQEINRTYTFNRTFTLDRYFNDISMMLVDYIYMEDIERAGYSLHELAGEELLFEVSIEKVYKPSQ